MSSDAIPMAFSESSVCPNNAAIPSSERPAVADRPRVPYPGLRPFRRQESTLFFGRDEQIEALLIRLHRSRFLAIVGTSGSGKSSLVKAGLIPELDVGGLGAVGSDWLVVDMHPENSPLANLAREILACGVLGKDWPCDEANFDISLGLLLARLKIGPRALIELLKAAPKPRPTKSRQPTNLLIVVDQFEEIFRFYAERGADEAMKFVNLLMATADCHEVSVYIVLTMRSDYLGECSVFPGLPELLNKTQFLCPRLTRDQMQQAISLPARLFGGDVDPGLVNQMLNDVGSDSDQLPLVQHVLARMWRLNFGGQFATELGRANRTLRIADYRAVGGLKENSEARNANKIEHSSSAPSLDTISSTNALSRHADEAYFELRTDSTVISSHKSNDKRPGPRFIAEMMFRSLVERGASGSYVRRLMPLKELAAISDCAIDELIKVIDVFRREDRNFLTPPMPPKTNAHSKSDLQPETIIGITHEALIRQWQRFGGEVASAASGNELSHSWLGAEDLCRRRYRRLTEAAESEATNGLLKHPELSFLSKWWQEFNPTEAWGNYCVPRSYQRTKTFLGASKKAFDDKVQRKKQKREQELETIKELALAQKNRAEQQEALVKVQRDHAEEQSKFAAQQTKLVKRTRRYLKIAVACALLACGCFFAAVVAMVQSGREAQRTQNALYGNQIRRAQFEWENNSTVVAQDLLKDSKKNREQCLWEFHYLQRQFEKNQRTLLGSKGTVYAMGVSPDGKSIVSASDNRRILQWDYATGALLREFVSSSDAIPTSVKSLSFAPEGQRFVTGNDDGIISVWTLDNASPLTAWHAHEATILALAFSPDGKSIVSGSQDGALRVWDADSQKLLFELLDGPKELKVNSVAFNPDGNWIVSGHEDSSLRLWDVESHKLQHNFTGHAEAVNCAVFSPDSQFVFSGSDDSTVNKWDTKSGVLLATAQRHLGAVISIGIEGEHLITGSGDNLLKVWQTSDLKELFTLRGHTGRVESICICPNEHKIVSGGTDAAIKIWELKKQEPARTIHDAHQKRVWNTSFSKDGQFFLSTSDDRTLKVWDRRKPVNPFRVFEDTGRVYCAKFSPDGKEIVSGGTEGASIWNLETGQRIPIERQHDDSTVTGVVFSADGKKIVSCSKDGELKVWDAVKKNALRTLTAPKSKDGSAPEMTWVAFHPDSRRVAGSSDDGLVRIWDTDTGNMIRELRGHTSKVFACDFSPDGTKIVSASKDRSLKIWNTDSEIEPLTLTGHRSTVLCVAFDPSGYRIVSGSFDRNIIVWNSTNGEELLSLADHTTDVWTVAFSPDGNQIISGSSDGQIKTWDGTPDAIANP